MTTITAEDIGVILFAVFLLATVAFALFSIVRAEGARSKDDDIASLKKRESDLMEKVAHLDKKCDEWNSKFVVVMDERDSMKAKIGRVAEILGFADEEDDEEDDEEEEDDDEDLYCFACGITARKKDEIAIRQTVFLVRAASEAEALGKAHIYANRHYPEADYPSRMVNATGVVVDPKRT